MQAFRREASVGLVRSCAVALCTCLAAQLVIVPAPLAIGAGAEQKAETVGLVIDYGDGAELRFKALPWRAGMTALDVLSAVGSHRHGVKAVMRGSGRLALVTKIGDVVNEGGGEKSRNWIFSINGKVSDTGAGAAPVAPGDVVLWKFDTYQYNP